MPLVSVIIPTHNRANMLRDAIESVLAQTFREFEIIVIDDGSDDHTRDVATAYRGRVTYIHQENQGRARARNAGILASRGLYVSFLDDDDVWYPRKLELQVALLESRLDVDLVYGSVYFAGTGSRALITCEAPNQESLLEWLIFGDGIPAGASTITIRRETLHRSGLFDPALEPCEDMELWARIALRGGRFACVAEPVAEYRIHQGNSSHNKYVMQTARAGVLEKLSAASQVPPSMRTRRRHYLSRQWLRVGDELYMDSQLSTARSAWCKAVRLDFSLLTLGLVSLIAKSLWGPRLLGWARESKRAVLGIRSQ